MNDLTTAVIVSYGDRSKYFSKVISRLNELTNINKIIFINNEISDASYKNLMSSCSDKLLVYNQGENTGSAKGYKVGILEALKTDSNFIWLLDDDNLPEITALEKLYESWEVLGNRGLKNIALLAYRPDRNIFKKAIQRGEPSFMLGPKNSFLGFSLYHKLKRIISSNEEVGLNQSKLGRVDVAPYGGLLFHRSIIDLTGLPDERFFLYGDDYDFSYKITQNTDGIFLNLDSVVNDLEKSFHLKDKKVNILSNRFVNTNSKDKIFYSVRNGINFELKFVSNKFVYLSNAVIHILGTMSIFILRPSHLWKFKYYIKGIKSSKCFR